MLISYLAAAYDERMWSTISGVSKYFFQQAPYFKFRRSVVSATLLDLQHNVFFKLMDLQRKRLNFDKSRILDLVMVQSWACGFETRPSSGFRLSDKTFASPSS